jgi:hypothetical protein
MRCGRDAPIIVIHRMYLSSPNHTNYIITTSSTRHPGPLGDSPDYIQAHSSPWAAGCLLPLAHTSKAHSSHGHGGLQCRTLPLHAGAQEERQEILLRSEKGGAENQEWSHGGRGERTLPSLPDRTREDDSQHSFVDAHEQCRGTYELDLRPGGEGSEPAAAWTLAAPPKIWWQP